MILGSSQSGSSGLESLRFLPVALNGVIVCVPTVLVVTPLYYCHLMGGARATAAHPVMFGAAPTPKIKDFVYSVRRTVSGELRYMEWRG